MKLKGVNKKSALEVQQLFLNHFHERSKQFNTLLYKRADICPTCIKPMSNRSRYFAENFPFFLLTAAGAVSP